MSARRDPYSYNPSPASQPLTDVAVLFKWMANRNQEQNRHHSIFTWSLCKTPQYVIRFKASRIMCQYFLYC